MAKPVVEHFDTNLFLNSIVNLRDLISYVDEDGDAAMHFDVDDFNTDERSGYFRLNGIAQTNGEQFRVSAADVLSGAVEYVSGSVIGFERFRVVATDVTGEFSAANVFGTVYTVRENVTRPVTFDVPFSALADEATAVGPFLQGRDPDGYPITLWQVRYRGDDNSFLTVNGERVAEDGSYTLVRGQEAFDSIRLHATGPAASGKLDKLNYDGQFWSRVQTSDVTIIPNVNRPVAQFTRGNAISRETIPMAPLVNVIDGDNNTSKYLEFWNTNPHASGGDLVFQGVVQPRKQWIRVLPEDLDQLQFVAPNRDLVQQIRYRGFDGKFRSNHGTISITTEFIEPPVLPEIANPGLIYDQQLVELQVDSLFTQRDDGTPFANFQIYDGNDPIELSASFEFNTNRLPAFTIHEFSAAEIQNNVRLRTGDYNNRSIDDMYVRAQNQDGLWTGWERLRVRTEPEYIGAHDDNNDWADAIYGVPRDAEGRLVLTYSFMQDFPNYETGEATDPNPSDPPEYFSQLNQSQRESVRRAFDDLEAVANVKFNEASDQLPNLFGQRGGMFRFGNYGIIPPENGPAILAFTFTPSFAPQSADVWFNRVTMGTPLFDEEGEIVDAIDTDLVPGTGQFTTLHHELMHAMGYMHTFEAANGSAILPRATNNDYFSVLSSAGRRDFLNPTTPQLYDVETLQRDYGPNFTFNSGDSVYGLDDYWSESNVFAETLWDGGGNDTLSLVGSDPLIGFGFPNVADLSPGAFSTFNGFEDNVSISFRAIIENAIGSDLDDTLRGNFVANTIIGGNGDDLIEGRVGDDLLTGGVGSDRFIYGVGDGNDIIDEQRGAGRDVIELTPFPTLDELDKDFKFRLEGRDLIIDLRLDESDVQEGSIRVADYLWGRSRVETLELNGTRIDLTNLVSQISPVNDTFAVTTSESDLGFLVAPV